MLNPISAIFSGVSRYAEASCALASFSATVQRDYSGKRKERNIMGNAHLLHPHTKPTCAQTDRHTNGRKRTSKTPSCLHHAFHLRKSTTTQIGMHFTHENEIADCVFGISYMNETTLQCVIVVQMRETTDTA